MCKVGEDMEIRELKKSYENLFVDLNDIRRSL